MAVKKVTDLDALTSVADDDLIMIVDVSDTTDSDDGTSKKITKANLVSSAEYFTAISGAYVSGTGSFYNFPIPGFSQVEATSLQWYHKFSVPANCRLVDVALMYQRGASGRTIDLTAYDHSIAGQGSNLGSSTNGPLNATTTSGGRLVFDFDTSDFDYTSSSQVGLGINIGGTISSSSTLLGVVINMRFKFL